VDLQRAMAKQNGWSCPHRNEETLFFFYKDWASLPTSSLNDFASEGRIK
jgi:hypothetical protein